MGPADFLEGKTLHNGWKAIRKLVPKPTGTGGNFSTGYIVEHTDGRKAFLKAMDYARAFRGPMDMLAININALTSAYIFEKTICERCRDRKLDRVVHAIETFTYQLEPANDFSKVECMIFELADGDVRSHLSTAASFDIAFVLRSLHQVAVGLEQLHRADMAHQDLKPSNVLVFSRKVGTKVSDLGRAWAKNISVAHDNLDVAGDPSYAPIEAIYQSISTDVHIRRYGCDTYHLGSLISFFFTGTHANALTIKHLAPEHRPYSWGGTYSEVLPYVQDAFSLALAELGTAIDPLYKRDLVEMVSYLCQPDPNRRGHPLCGRGNTQFGLERFISRFDLLAAKAEAKLAAGLK